MADTPFRWALPGAHARTTCVLWSLHERVCLLKDMWVLLHRRPPGDDWASPRRITKAGEAVDNAAVHSPHPMPRRPPSSHMIGSMPLCLARSPNSKAAECHCKLERQVDCTFSNPCGVGTSAVGECADGPYLPAFISLSQGSHAGEFDDVCGIDCIGGLHLSRGEAPSPSPAGIAAHKQQGGWGWERQRRSSRHCPGASTECNGVAT